jgi:hypothetical protein
VTEPRICKAPDCDKVVDPKRVELYGAETCDPICRAKAWKADTGYGHQDPARRPSPAVRTASRKPSGLQVSYRKAVEGCVEALRECGVDLDEAELIAEKRMRSALSAKQLAKLEAREQEPEPEPSVPLVLTPEAAVDAPVTRDESEPTGPVVRIEQRQRNDRDTMEWVEIDQVETRAEPRIALTIWLEEQEDDPLPGGYRAVGEGGVTAETTVGSMAA